MQQLTKNQSLTIQVGRTMAETIRAIAKSEEETVSATVRRIIRRGLEHERNSGARQLATGSGGAV